MRYCLIFETFPGQDTYVLSGEPVPPGKVPANAHTLFEVTHGTACRWNSGEEPVFRIDGITVARLISVQRDRLDETPPEVLR